MVGLALHFTGHIIAAPDKAGRFPAIRENCVVQAISAYLDEHEIAAAYGSLAAGADLLVIEGLLARNVPVHGFLPFAEEHFLESSVAQSKASWVRRFHTARAGLASLEVLDAEPEWPDSDQFPGPNPYAACSARAMESALTTARKHRLRTEQLAIWDGAITDAPAGTYTDIQAWANLGGRTVVISLNGKALTAASLD